MDFYNPAMNDALQNRLFVKSPDFVARKIAGEIVLIPLKRHLEEVSSIFSLNEVGAMVWEAIDGKTNVGGIRSTLLETFDVSTQDLDKDLEILFGQLEEIKAISSL